ADADLLSAAGEPARHAESRGAAPGATDIAARPGSTAARPAGGGTERGTGRGDQCCPTAGAGSGATAAGKRVLWRRGNAATLRAVAPSTICPSLLLGAIHFD